MSIFKKLKPKHWVSEAIDDIIFVIIYAAIPVICLALFIGANSRIHKFENAIKAKYSCEEAVLGFNDYKFPTEKPKGYYVEARYYADNGEMTRQYHHIAEQSIESHKKDLIIRFVFGYMTIAMVLFMPFFIFSGINDIIFIHDLNKERDDIKRTKDKAA